METDRNAIMRNRPGLFFHVWREQDTMTEEKPQRFSHATGEERTICAVPMPEAMRSQIDQFARDQQISRAAAARQLLMRGLAAIEQETA